MIRAARPSDKRAIRDLCARIWSDDYVLHVFDEWVRDRRGRFWVMVENGQVIGIAKLTLMGEREGWLHALRVDPRHRRRGVATALLRHRLERARRLGARVVRLDTAEDNVAVRRLMRHSGFRRIGRLAFFDVSARDIPPPRRASRKEIDEVWPLIRRGDGLLHDAHLVRRLARTDLARAVRAGRCLVAGSREHATAVAIVEPQEPTPGGHGHGSRVAIRAIGGTPRGLVELLRALRGHAKAAKSARVGIAAPAKLWAAARTAGYRRRWPETMLLFERAL